MNLLQEITITGTVHPTHARLSIHFHFHNPTSHPLSPTYIFPLPESATITGMQILTEDKNLLRAKIVSVMDSDFEEKGFRLIQLDPQLYSLTWECLPADEACTILIECLLPISPKNGVHRMALPLIVPSGNGWNTSPCPVNLTLTLKGLEPLRLSPLDIYQPDTNTLSCTARTDMDFVLDFSESHPTSCGYLQEEFGKGCGFARLRFPAEKLLDQPGKSSVLLLLDLSHASTQRLGNALKELYFRFFSAVPDGISVQCLTTDGQLPEGLSADELYRHLQTLPIGTGDLEVLLQSIAPASNVLTVLVSDGAYSPSVIPDFPILLATTGSVRQTTLSHLLHGEHLHFYPEDHPEKFLSSKMKQLLYSKQPIEIIPKDGIFHDCVLSSSPSSLVEGYLDVAFSYSGRLPSGIAICQGNEERLTCPLLGFEKYTQFPDAHQLFSLAKCHNLTTLLEKASPVSSRTIKRELGKTQTEANLLGSETAFLLPTEESYSGVPALFYSHASALHPLPKRPTIFGEGTRTLSRADREHLADRCRQTIHNSIRSDGSIHSPLGITPRVSAEETALSYLALLADGKTDSSILQYALSYLNSAPETPWSHLLSSAITKESLQTLLPSLPPFETLLDSLGDSLPLGTANYLLLWISLM